MFLPLLARILSVFVLIFLGAGARRSGLLNADSTTRLAKSVKNFFYPALIFHSLFNNFTLERLSDNYLLPLGAFLIMALGYIWGLASAGLIRFREEREKHSFLFQCAINNYSFLPLPLVLMLWGERGVAMLIFSSLGSEIAVWTFGVFALSGNRFRRDSLKNLASAPMVSIILAVLAILARDLLPGSGLLRGAFFAQAADSAMFAIETLGGATIPVAMFVVGSRILMLESGHIFTLRQLYVALLRLIIIPASAAAALFLMPLSPEMRRVLLVVAVMPSANASVVLSEAYGSDADFAASSVLLTHLFALVTIPMWLSIFL